MSRMKKKRSLSQSWEDLKFQLKNEKQLKVNQQFFEKLDASKYTVIFSLDLKPVNRSPIGQKKWPYLIKSGVLPGGRVKFHDFLNNTRNVDMAYSDSENYL